MIDIIAKILPIIIVSVLFLYQDETIDFSHTILGRLIAVSIILFYITYDILYGIVACLLVILYYQFDFVDERSNSKVEMINLEGFQEGKKNRGKVNVKKEVKNAGKKIVKAGKDVIKAFLKTPIGKFITTQLNSIKKEVLKDVKKDVKKVETELNAQIKNLKTDITDFKGDISAIKNDITTIKRDVNNNSADILKNANNPPKNVTNGFTNYSDLYDELKKEHDTKNNVKNIFKQRNCQNGELKFKNITVKNEIAPHIFPELKYENEPCNPCSNTCNYSIIEAKLRTEDTLIKPINSNDITPTIVKSESNTIPSIGVVSESFSSYK
jgi:hypothetical protein